MNDGQMSHRRRKSPNSSIKKRKVSNSVEHRSKPEIYTPPDKYLKYYIEDENEEKDIEEKIEDNGERLITFKDEQVLTINSEEERKLRIEQIDKKKKEIDELIIQLKEDEMIDMASLIIDRLTA